MNTRQILDAMINNLESGIDPNQEVEFYFGNKILIATIQTETGGLTLKEKPCKSGLKYKGF